MKRLLISVMCLVLLAGASSAFAARGLGNIDQTPTVAVGGDWTVDFCWDGGGCGQTVWLVKQIAIFFTVDVGDAPEAVDGVGITLSSLFFNQYLNGCRPLYNATNATSTSMSGVMACKDGAGTGTWTAGKGAARVTESVNGGMTSDGKLVE